MIEYYKFIGPVSAFGGSAFTINKIYKIRNPKYIEDISNFIDDQGHENGFSEANSKYFIPSTKEEFDNQENNSITVIEEDLDFLIPMLKKLNIT